MCANVEALITRRINYDITYVIRNKNFSITQTTFTYFLTRRFLVTRRLVTTTFVMKGLIMLYLTFITSNRYNSLYGNEACSKLDFSFDIKTSKGEYLHRHA